MPGGADNQTFKRSQRKGSKEQAMGCLIKKDNISHQPWDLKNLSIEYAVHNAPNSINKKIPVFMHHGFFHRQKIFYHPQKDFLHPQKVFTILVCAFSPTHSCITNTTYKYADQRKFSNQKIKHFYALFPYLQKIYKLNFCKPAN